MTKTETTARIAFLKSLTKDYDDVSTATEQLYAPENLIPGHVLMRSNCGQDRVQGSNSERRMRGHGDSVRRGYLGLKNNVAADLVDSQVVPSLAKMLYEILTAQVAREFQAIATTSSRVR